MISFNGNQCDPAEIPYWITDRGFSLIWQGFLLWQIFTLVPLRGFFKPWRLSYGGLCIKDIFLKFLKLGNWRSGLPQHWDHAFHGLLNASGLACWAWYNFCFLSTSALRDCMTLTNAVTSLWLFPFLSIVSSFQLANSPRHGLFVHIWCQEQKAFWCGNWDTDIKRLCINHRVMESTHYIDLTLVFLIKNIQSSWAQQN